MKAGGLQRSRTLSCPFFEFTALFYYGDVGKKEKGSGIM